jgi:hypothetical protein
MTRTRHTDVTHGHGALPRDLAANQRRPVELVTRRAAQRAERAALDNLAGAATDQLVPIGTHHQQPDPSQILDTGHRSPRSPRRLGAWPGCRRRLR